jgi:hypothetical protein
LKVGWNDGSDSNKQRAGDFLVVEGKARQDKVKAPPSMSSYPTSSICISVISIIDLSRTYPAALTHIS